MKSSPRVAVEQWQVQTEDGQQYGPITRPELDQWFAEGRITAETQLLLQGAPAWQWATEIYPQLAAEAQRTTPSGFPDFSAPAKPTGGGSGPFDFGTPAVGSGAHSSVSARGRGGRKGGRRGGGSPHIDYIAYTAYGIGALSSVGFLLSIVFAAGIAALFGSTGDKVAGAVGGMMATVFTVLGIIGLLISSIWFVAAYGVQERAAWGRLLMLILAVVWALSGPLNIAFAVWCYVVLTDRDNAAVFR
jgi:hypothetical protein